jgi:cleavage and polyadenylation specificity factor subunit 1
MPPAETAAATPPASILTTSPSGAVSLLTPLPEATYRRLFALQTHLITILDHPCSLNPRAYRAVESEGFGGRGVLDGSLLKRWTELSSQKKIEACKRIGEEVETVRGWLELLGGGALGYL